MKLKYDDFINTTELIVAPDPNGAPRENAAFIMTRDRTVGVHVFKDAHGNCKFAKWSYCNPAKIFRNIEEQFDVKVEDEKSIS